MTLDPLDQPERDEGFPTFEHGQWTFEGEIERLGAFASGARRATGWRRRLAQFVAWTFILALAAGVVQFVRMLAEL